MDICVWRIDIELKRLPDYLVIWFTPFYGELASIAFFEGLSQS